MCQTPGAGIRRFLAFNLALNLIQYRARREGLHISGAGET